MYSYIIIVYSKYKCLYPHKYVIANKAPSGVMADIVKLELTSVAGELEEFEGEGSSKTVPQFYYSPDL
jgi:hypothetical protein